MRMTCIRRWQNVLEPLATIHNVSRSVTIRGVTLDWQVRRSTAMESETRMVERVKSRMMLQLCNKRARINIENFDWDEDLPDDRNEAYGTGAFEQRCCKACTELYAFIDEN